MKMKMKNKLHRYDKNKSESRQGQVCQYDDAFMY